MTNTTSQTSAPIDCPCHGSGLAGRRHRRRWFTVLAVMACATAMWGVLHSLLHIDLAVRQGGRVQQVDSLAVTLTSLVVGLLGWLTLTLLERRTQRAVRVWRLLGAGVLLVSLTGPAAAVSLSAGLALVSMHLVVGVGLLLALPGRRREH
ncbi:DUF6069 family protein [Angustibacter sp. Root456]|uniref:DUF6069 family protein n=1 Tax=Angustibacter sp. Root456 TaxID=1736539 RepID=UPI0006FC6B6A|nr:DUF6069 family protein [Angustibacter sp. Root456]KQX65677.1 hypothetical protein ASD06_08590 [Angustibacter sp. Root456]